MMVRPLIFVSLLVAGSLCVFAMSRKPPAELGDRSETLTIFLTGSALGELQPCGCSGGQLGGFDRRGTILNSLPPSKRLIVDMGLFVEEVSEQNLLKFDTMMQALALLGYDLVNLTEKDIEIARSTGALDDIGSLFDIISSQVAEDANVPRTFTKEFLLGGKKLAVVISAFDAEKSQIEKAEKLFACKPGIPTVNILILSRCDAGTVASISDSGIFDCLVCPAESDEPMIIGSADRRPLVVSAGRFGKYVGRLEISAEGEPPNLKLRFSSEPVKETLGRAKELVELYKSYQQLVRDAGLLEKLPRFALPKSLRYSGSEACKNCHEYEYSKWSTKKHAHAYETLEKVSSQFDPECVVCHVVGLEYEGGFVSVEQTSHLKDVGCENCHGLGTEHIRSLGEIGLSEPKSECGDCHTPERSANYAGNENTYFEKIIHWREPNTADNVKRIEGKKY
ncbi:MAG: multiheme c-type cytochrome [Planctomycetota bacterium]|jgi:hypothetical protein